MPKNQLSFFATKSDTKLLFENVEKLSLHFLLTGLFDSPNVALINSLLTISDFGKVSVGDINQTKTYLASDRKNPFKVRAVPQKHGDTKYAIDQLVNPKTIMFRPGGVLKEKSLIAGQIGTISDDPASLKLFDYFKKIIQHQFSKIKSFYVGVEAEKLLDKGWRLTANVETSTLYDLKRN